MRKNLHKVTAGLKQSCCNLVALSRDLKCRLDPGSPKEQTDLNTYDESILQQSRLWMSTVTWSLIGSTVFGITWLALARTEEIVIATGQLEPIDSVHDIQMPLGGVIDQILVKEGDRVQVGQVLMKLDTEASEKAQQPGEDHQTKAGAIDAEEGGKTQHHADEPGRGADAGEQSCASDRNSSTL